MTITAPPGVYAGISASSGAAIAVVDSSLLVGNAGFGVGVSGTAATVMPRASTLSENVGGGVRANGGASISASGNAVSRNGGPGFANAGAGSSLRSFVDNALDGNNGGDAQTSGTITALPLR